MFVFLLSPSVSIVKMFAQNKEDKKRVEEALQSVYGPNITKDKVIKIFFMKMIYVSKFSKKFLLLCSYLILFRSQRLFYFG